jgi:2,3-bisphosphoglycerate-independent phosphoglycerate mutase
MGNSEVGHMNLGAGRIVYVKICKINLAVNNNTLAQEQVLKDAFQYAKDHRKSTFLGLVSWWGSNSHTSHLRGLIAATQSYGLEKSTSMRLQMDVM